MSRLPLLPPPSHIGLAVPVWVPCHTYSICSICDLTCSKACWYLWYRCWFWTRAIYKIPEVKNTNWMNNKYFFMPSMQLLQYKSGERNWFLLHRRLDWKPGMPHFTRSWAQFQVLDSGHFWHISFDLLNGKETTPSIFVVYYSSEIITEFIAFH